MDLDTSERDGGKRIYSRLGPAQDRYQKVCFHWQNGRCNRYPCPYLHSELPPKRANYSSNYSSNYVSNYSSPDDPRSFQGGGSGFTRRNPNPNSSALSNHNGPNPAVSNHNGPPSKWGRSRGGGGGGGARVPTKNPEKMCGYWLKGKCTYGDNCRYLHASSIGETFSFLKLLEGHEQAVSGIALPSASDKLYSGGKDGTVRLWDCQTGQCAAIVSLGDEIGCMISEGPWLFVGLPNVIKAWNIQTNTDLSLSGPVGQVYALVAANDMLFAGTQDGSILAWRFNVPGNCFEPAAYLAGHQRAVVSMVVGAQRLFSSSMDNTIRVWDLGTLQCVETLTDHTSVVMSVLCWDQFLLSCSLDKTIKVWAATESGKLEVTYTHIEEHGILALCGMHDAQAKPVLLCSCNDNCVRIYDLPSFAERGKIFSKEEVRSIQIGPGGLFFTGDGSGELKVWNWLATEQSSA